MLLKEKKEEEIMCDHKRDNGKEQVFISGLCRNCSSDERFDQKQMVILNSQSIENQMMKTVETYRKLFLS